MAAGRSQRAALRPPDRRGRALLRTLPKHSGEPARRRSRGLGARRSSAVSRWERRWSWAGAGSGLCWPSSPRCIQGPWKCILALLDAGLEIGEDGLDVALRIDRPDDPTAITRKIASSKRLVCAAPSYLAARGMPKTPADLADHECLRLARRHRLHDRWRFRTGSGVEEIKVSGHFSSGSGDVLHAWALEGRGLSLEALWDVAEDLKAGRLAACITAGAPTSISSPVPPGRTAPPRIRLFVDLIAAAHL